MIHLDNSNLIARGEIRSCYQVPGEDSLCVKVVHAECKKIPRSIKRELDYIKKYSPRIRLPKYYATTLTNLGTGYIFERIKNYDGKTSMTLTDYHRENKNIELTVSLLNKMFNSFLHNRIAVSDFHPGNILVNFDTPRNKPSLVLIDGIGNSDFIKICDYSKFFLKKKLVRKFNRLMRKLGIPNNDIK